MMRCIKNWTIISLFCFCCFACSKSREPIVEEGEIANTTVSFKPNVETKGVITDNNTIKDFGVFCFHTGLITWDAMQESQRLPNKMFNVKVAKAAAGDWKYDPVQEWGVGTDNYFTFMGYSPYTPADAPANGIEIITKDADAGSAKIKFTSADQIADQIDLLVVNTLKDFTPRMLVGIHLGHALSRIGFQVQLEKNSDAGTEVTITDVKLNVNVISTLGKTGELDLLTKTWGNISNPIQEGAISLPVPGTPPVLSVDPSVIIADNSFLFIVPQDIEPNWLSIDIVTSTKIGNNTPVSRTYPGIKIPKTVLESGKSYNYLYKIVADKYISLKEVKITPWTVKSGGEYDI